MRLLLFIAVLWTCSVHKVKALTCLKCDSVVQPRHCTTVMTCPDNDVCFVEKRVNSFGEDDYNLGCMSDQVCKNFTSTSSSSRCSQCCTKDLCNQEGCGEPGYPDSRGPVCYNCIDGVPAGRCHHIDICRPGEICSVSGKNIFGTTVFASQCMHQESCVAHQGHGLDIIGKRGFMSRLLARSFDVNDCFHCCTADLCNKNCQNTDDGGRDCHGHATQAQNCTTDQGLVSDCFHLKSLDSTRPSGVYNITTPLSHTKTQVYCDMDTDGGGWTIFQRRYNGSEDFYRNFVGYENGFGNAHGEYWLGLKYIQEITSNGEHQLRVDIDRFNGSKGFEVYGHFSLQPGPSYTLNLGSLLQSHGVDPRNKFFSGNTTSPVGMAFSTYDHDVDMDIRSNESNCARYFHSGWWFNKCFLYLNLNGMSNFGYDAGYDLAGSTMMLR